MTESWEELAVRKGYGRIRINSFRGKWSIRLLSYSDIKDETIIRFEQASLDVVKEMAAGWLSDQPDNKEKYA